MKTVSFFVLGILLAGRIDAQKYLGCFRSAKDQPDLSLVQSWPSPPAQCADECRHRYFMFAGLMRGEQCYCGSHYGREGPSHGCTLHCSLDSLNFCGSEEAISVYETGQKGPSPPRRLQVIESGSTNLSIAWERPDVPNGNLTSYAITTNVESTHAFSNILPSETTIQGGNSNATVLTALHPGTKYNITIKARNTNDESDGTSVLGWTSIGPPEKPQKPEVTERGGQTMRIRVPPGRSENGPVTSYRIMVVERYIIVPTSSRNSDRAVATNYEEAEKESLGYYVTGEFDAADYQRYEKFTIGDGKSIGGYYNAPLRGRFLEPQVGVVVVSRLGLEQYYAVSELANGPGAFSRPASGLDSTIIGLCVAIGILGTMLVIAVLAYFALRRRHTQNRMRKLPEQQELTLQGPVYEVDNMAYIPEDVPERANHYERLREKVWSIPKNCLSIDTSRCLRRGRFGSVHPGTVQQNGGSSDVTIHCITDGALRQSEKRHMLRDLDVCIKIGHMDNLAALVGTCETPDNLFVVIEMPPEVLKNRLLAARSGDVFPVGKILPIGAAVAGALRHLENHKIVHEQLCARSIGLTHDFTPKVMGHGIGKHGLQDVKYARWMAVECFGKQKKSPRGVVWAFGVLVWEMLSMGGTPYADFPTEIDVEEAVIDQGVKLPQLADTPDPLYQVLLSCWHTDPEERPTFEELVRLNTLSICPITAITEAYNPEMELNG